MPPKILLFGSGAIGTIYVYLLLKAGCDVTAVCRSNYDAAHANGLRIDSAMYGKDIRIRPRVVRDCEEAAALATETNAPYDYILVTTKVLPTAGTPFLIRPAVTPGHTTIVLIQNGIDIEPPYVAAFPTNPLLSCVVYLPTTQVAPGHIVMGEDERLEIGTFPSSSSSDSPAQSSASNLITILRSAGSNATFFPDIQGRRWFKLLLNAPWNPICALTCARDVAVLRAGESAGAEGVIAGVMDEVVRLSAAVGYPETTKEAAEAQLDRARARWRTEGIEPSMLVDVRCGRAMEVEAILGNPVRVARRLGVDVPRMEMLYVLTKVLDESAARRKEGQSLGGLDLGEVKAINGA